MTIGWGAILQGVDRQLTRFDHDFLEQQYYEGQIMSCAITVDIHRSENLGALYAAGSVTLARPAWRSVPSGGGLFCIPWCMDDCQDTEEGEPERSAGSPIQQQLLGHALAMGEAGQTARLKEADRALSSPAEKSFALDHHIARDAHPEQ